MRRGTVICSKAGTCNNLASHVLIYLDKTSFKEITNKPKPYCRYHAEYMQMILKQQHDILSRIYTMDEWFNRIEEYRKRGGKEIISKI
jgi:hypothetical protein